MLKLINNRLHAGVFLGSRRRLREGSQHSTSEGNCYAAGIDTGGCTVSRSIAATLHTGASNLPQMPARRVAAMLRKPHVKRFCPKSVIWG